jgi:hypothetical protein
MMVIVDHMPTNRIMTKFTENSFLGLYAATVQSGSGKQHL